MITTYYSTTIVDAIISYFIDLLAGLITPGIAPINGYNVGSLILNPILTAPFHAYFDLFSGLIQTVVFISLSTIFIGQELPEEIDVKISEKGETI